MRKREYLQHIPVAYAQPLLDELRRLDCDLEALWRQAQLRTPLAALLRGQVAALPAAEFIRFYRHSIGSLEVQCCVRDGARPTGKLLCDMLCYCVIHVATLRDVIRRAARFMEAMEDRGGTLGLVEQGPVARFTMDAHRRQRDSAALLVDLTGLLFYYQFYSWLIGRPLRLLEVGVAYAPPAHDFPLLQVFGVPLRYQQPVNSLSFAARALDQRVVRTHAELEAIIDFLPFDLGLHGVVESRLSDQVRLRLLDALQHHGQALSCSAVAQLLHASPATLRRRLSAEGTSYAELRASCQREAAETLLAQTELPLIDIALRLGLGGDRAFRRAFRQWTGLAPSEYRARARG